MGTGIRPTTYKPRYTQLSKPKKKVAAKVLREQEGYKASEIAKWLNISEVTAWRYMQLDTPEKLKEFEKEFASMVQMMKYDGIGKVYKRINELIPTEERLDQIVKAGEFLEGRQNQTNVQNNIVVAVPEDLNNKYGIPRVTTEDNTEQ